MIEDSYFHEFQLYESLFLYTHESNTLTINNLDFNEITITEYSMFSIKLDEYFTC